MSSISATVVDLSTISQSEDGSITTAGTAPLYCDTDSAGDVMCYY